MHSLSSGAYFQFLSSNYNTKAKGIAQKRPDPAEVGHASAVALESHEQKCIRAK